MLSKRVIEKIFDAGWKKNAVFAAILILAGVTQCSGYNVENFALKHSLKSTTLETSSNICYNNNTILEVIVEERGGKGHGISNVEVSYNGKSSFTEKDGKVNIEITDIEGNKIIKFYFSKKGYRTEGPIPYIYQQNNPTLLVYLSKDEIGKQGNVIVPKYAKSDIIKNLFHNKQSKKFKGNESLNAQELTGDKLSEIIDSAKEQVTKLSGQAKPKSKSKDDKTNTDIFKMPDLTDIFSKLEGFKPAMGVPRDLVLSTSTKKNTVNFDLVNSMSFDAEVYFIDDVFYFKILPSNRIQGYINNPDNYEYHGKFSNEKLEIFFKLHQNEQISRLKYIGQEN